MNTFWSLTPLKNWTPFWNWLLENKEDEHLSEFMMINIQHAYNETLPASWIEELKSLGLSVNVTLKSHSKEVIAIRVFMYTVEDLNKVQDFLSEVYLIDDKDRWIEREFESTDMNHNVINLWLDGFTGIDKYL